MNHAIAFGIALKKLNRIRPRRHHPSAIAFHLHQCRIRLSQQNRIARLSRAEIPELMRVIVIRKLDTRLLRFLSNAIGPFRNTFEIVQRKTVELGHNRTTTPR